MKRTLRSLALLTIVLSVSNLALAQASAQIAINLSKEEQGVVSFLKRYDDAIVKRDIKKLEEYLSGDFMMITPIGSMMTRAQILAPFQPSVENRSALESIETTNFQVKTYGESAVATAITSHIFKATANRPVSKYRNTYSMVQTNGQWQIAAIHVYKFPN